jgi:hypothetical protein
MEIGTKPEPLAVVAGANTAVLEKAETYHLKINVDVT